jgi:hypothetical protein
MANRGRDREVSPHGGGSLNGNYEQHQLNIPRGGPMQVYDR